MKKTIFISLATPLPWFLSCRIAAAQAPVTQSDQITDDGSQKIIQTTAAPNP